jgi:hypothetical protein
MQQFDFRNRSHGWVRHWLVLAVLLLALPAWCAAATASLSATLLPGPAGASGSRLAVHWSGPTGARLRVRLRRHGATQRTLVAGRALEHGTALVAVPLAAASDGSLDLVATDAAGTELARNSRSLDALRGSSAFAWESVFHGPGVDDGNGVSEGGVGAMVVWDDGSGPALYVGGGFVTAGSHEVTRIARWDGSTWAELAGPNGSGVSITGAAVASVKALAVYDGALVVAGFFDHAGGIPVHNIARWDGGTWSALGSGLDGGIGVEALLVFDGHLVAGGTFTAAGDTPVKRIASWDGNAWSGIGGGVDQAEFNQTVRINALADYDGALIAGGNFLEAGSTAVNRIARWDGSAWSALGSGVSDASNPGAELPSVRALVVFGTDLVAGGNFTRAGGATASLIARWDGSAWSPLGAGMSGEGNISVRALAVQGAALVAAGNFDYADAITANNIARWDGNAWAALAGSAGTGTNGGISTLATFGGDLVVAGGSASFTRAGGVVARSIARWTGADWATLSGTPGTGLPGFGIPAQVMAMALYQGDLVVGGQFTYAGSEVVHNIARWNGSAWSRLGGPTDAGVDGLPGGGVTPEVDALAVYDDDLIVGGRFLVAGETLVQHIARWDGSIWSALGPDGSGVNGSSAGVHALTVADGALVVAGHFDDAGGVAAANIARWDGSTWSALAAGFNDQVDALTDWNGTLIAGGFFTQSGTTTTSAIARWDGNAWSALGFGMNGIVLALGEFNGDLVAGGNFSRADGNLANRIARWDGSGWHAMGAGVNGNVLALADYAGTLVAGGAFDHSGSIPVNGVARWDGSSWAQLAGPAGVGVGGYPLASVAALAPYDADGSGAVPEKLAVGGRFNVAGGVADWSLALYGPAIAQGSLEVTPREVDFGDVIVGDAAATRTVTLSSLGNVAVTVSAIGAPAAPFSAASGTCPAAPFTLDPGSSCTLSFGFAPSGTGAALQTLAISDDAGNSTITLSGNGVPLPPPAITLDPADVTSSLARGESTTVALVIGNGGGETLEWSLDTSGSDGCDVPATLGWLELDPAAGSVVRDGSSPATLGIDTTALAVGSHEASLCLASNDPAQPRVRLPVSLEVTPKPASLGVDPAEVSVDLASGSTLQQTLTVANAGDEPLDWAITQEPSRAAVPGTAPGLDGDAIAAVVWDDGTGPALYVTGDFTTADGLVVNHIARWDGRRWSTLGSGLDRGGSALAVFDGALYAGGSFNHAGGVPASRIARWDGSQWSALGAGVGGGSTLRVSALAVYGSQLVAAGNFTEAGGNAVGYIAAWDGSNWLPLGSGVDSQVAALAVYDGALVAGGVFDNAGGVAAGNIARWNGSEWSALGGGVDSVVLALGLHDGKLVAGGGFTSAGGVPANRIAAWDGSQWSALGDGINTQVGAFVDYHGALAVGGLFSQAGGQAAANVAVWDGSTWSALGSGASARVSSLAVFHDALVAGGSFHQAGGVDAERIARWNGSEWSALSPEPIDCSLPPWMTVAPETGSLDGGANQPVSLDFDTSGVAPGDYTANLCFTSNDTENPLLVVPLAAHVTPAAAQLLVTPPNLDFGTIPTTITAGPIPVTLTSIGTGPVTIDTIGLPHAPYVVGGNTCPPTPFDLAPGASCQVPIAFSPTRPGSFDDALSVTGSGGNLTVPITGAAVVSIPATITLLGGSNQSATVGTAFPLPLAVQVRDAYNNPVPGINVQFGAPADGPGAVLSATAAPTDANGYASITADANGEAGSYVVTATGAPGAPVEFALTNLPRVADIAIGIAVDRDQVRRGQMLDYLVTLHNAAADAALGAGVASTLSPLLDRDFASWLCVDAPASGCTASGTGDILDGGLDIPAGASVSYLLTAPVRLDADDGPVQTSASASLDGDGNPADNTASVQTPVVVYRSGFEMYEAAGAPALRPATGTLDPDHVVTLSSPQARASLVTPILAASACEANRTCVRGDAGFRIEQLAVAGATWIRLVTIDGQRHEEASRWAPLAPGAELRVALVDLPAHDGVAGERTVLVAGAGVELDARLDATPTGYRVWSATAAAIVPLAKP